MNISNLLTVFLVILIIILTSYLFLADKPEQQEYEEPYYSEYANDWVEPAKETVKINMTESTEARGDYNLGYERYVDLDGSINSFVQTGSYKGDIFTISYEKNDKILMRIYPEMKPGDGIIEGFILVKREDGILNAYVFVDEDWKQRAKSMNIIYGEDIKDKDNLYSKNFDFSNSQDGIYIDKIKGIDWLAEQNPVTGRIFLGEISLNNIKSGDYNKTFIMMT